MIANRNKGFTLIEMLVSVSIFMLITSIVIFNHGKFNSQIVVTNLSYEVALAVRQAQVYGLAVRQDSLDVDNSVDYAYGVYFDVTSEESRKVFYIFADKDDNQQFNPAAGGGDPCDGSMECQERIEIRGDTEIRDLSTNSVTSSDTLTVLFLRPNPIAIIRDEVNTGANSSGRNQAIIELYSEKADKSKEIVIELSGQISVQDTN